MVDYRYLVATGNPPSAASLGQAAREFGSADELSDVQAVAVFRLEAMVVLAPAAWAKYHPEDAQSDVRAFQARASQPLVAIPDQVVQAK